MREKEKARKQYQQHVADGSVAAYSELKTDAPDVMKIAIGNIPPQETITIRFTYAEELQVAVNKFWLYKLPMTITPRYFNAPSASDTDSEQDMANLSNRTSKKFYSAELNLTILGACDGVYSPTH